MFTSAPPKALSASHYLPSQPDTKPLWEQPYLSPQPLAAPCPAPSRNRASTPPFLNFLSGLPCSHRSFTHNWSVNVPTGPLSTDLSWHFLLSGCYISTAEPSYIEKLRMMIKEKGGIHFLTHTPPPAPLRKQPTGLSQPGLGRRPYLLAQRKGSITASLAVNKTHAAFHKANFIERKVAGGEQDLDLGTPDATPSSVTNTIGPPRASRSFCKLPV